ncbi:MAG: GxxExxY protein [Ignavibacteria bacterium]|nr:GxxExxY protein [Ignavibacteria bacterium]
MAKQKKENENGGSQKPLKNKTKREQIKEKAIEVTLRVDFFVEGEVMVEIKAIEKLEDLHKAQAINYCKAYGIADDLLINFWGKSLDFKRVYNKNHVIPKIK